LAPWAIVNLGKSLVTVSFRKIITSTPKADTLEVAVPLSVDRMDKTSTKWPLFDEYKSVLMFIYLVPQIIRLI
jgi:hypothetical protein